MQDQVILVDADGSPIGSAEKMAAHREGRLHRAFSVFILNAAGQMLLQQRASDKYHSGGLWSNACCSHPRPGESVLDAAHRRLQEELGVDCPLDEVFRFTYRAALDNDLTEHEYDHVLIGTCDAQPAPNPQEVAGWRWVDLPELLHDIHHNPQRYTVWFKIVLERVVGYLENDKR